MSWIPPAWRSTWCSAGALPPTLSSFYRDRYFVVVKWQEADRKALEAFVRELEARLGKPKEPS